MLYAIELDTETIEETRKQRRIERQSSIEENETKINKMRTLWDKVVTEEFKEKRQEILKQQESWEITQEQARIILTEERRKLENKTTEINSTIVNIQNNRVFLRDDSNFQMRKNNAGKKIRLENQEKRKVEMEEIKDEFEKYRSQILNEIKDWTLSIKDAKTQLYNFRNTTIVNQREKYKTEREKEKLEHKTRINYLIIKQLSEKFSKYDTLSNQEKLEKYNNILLNINNKLNDSNLSEKQKLLLWLLEKIVSNKKKELS